jgi:hypothetical protein
MSNGVMPDRAVTLRLETLQNVLAAVRFLVGERVEYSHLYRILDKVEFLPSLVASGEPDDIRLFNVTVQELAEETEVFRPAANMLHE